MQVLKIIHIIFLTIVGIQLIQAQSFIEGRIKELENKISRAEVIDISSIDSTKVVFGATVKVVDLSNNSNHIYQIVGADEADIENNLISVSAPLSRAMINKSVDDIFEVITPNGTKEYQIKSIKNNCAEIKNINGNKI